MQALSQLSYSPIFAAFTTLLIRSMPAIISSFPAKPRLYNNLDYLQAPFSLFLGAISAFRCADIAAELLLIRRDTGAEIITVESVLLRDSHRAAGRTRLC
jgi:hypothetical protein